MAFSCPISFQKIDANALWLSSWFLLALFTMSLFFSWILFFLSIEFGLRLFYKASKAPLFLLAKTILALMQIKPSMEDAAPKKFAASIGFLMTLSLLFASLLHLKILFSLLFGLLVSCIALEALFRYCVGCKIYHFYIKGKALCQR